MCMALSVRANLQQRRAHLATRPNYARAEQVELHAIGIGPWLWQRPAMACQDGVMAAATPVCARNGGERGVNASCECRSFASDVVIGTGGLGGGELRMGCALRHSGKHRPSH